MKISATRHSNCLPHMACKHPPRAVNANQYLINSKTSGSTVLRSDLVIMMQCSHNTDIRFMRGSFRVRESDIVMC